ncbi:hypothetical protein HAX54_019744, partial [Datura stramonium]|nr:hypothetical protein [Datura stramonium]
SSISAAVDPLEQYEHHCSGFGDYFSISPWQDPDHYHGLAAVGNSPLQRFPKPVAT